MKTAQIVGLCVLCSVIGGGCKNQTIYEANAASLDRAHPGMTREEFLKDSPKAKLDGQRQVAGHTVTLYHMRHPIPNPAYTRYQHLYFFFVDDKLLRWGEDEDWPTSAEIDAAKAGAK